MKVSATCANIVARGEDKMQSVTIGNWSENLKPIWDRLIWARNLALEEAKKSPCVRRKYGAILFYTDEYAAENKFFAAHNNRVSNCCNGSCIRDMLSIQHGHNTDLGAEVHAEQSLLVHNWYHDEESFLIAGYDRNGNALFGQECWPCYSCARIVKEAGIKSVWVPMENEEFETYSIDSILEQYENLAIAHEMLEI